MWMKYYKNMVVPVLVVTALLGIMMIVFLLGNAHQSSRETCMHSLQLADDNISEMTGDMDYYMYSLWPNTQVMIILKRLLSNDTYNAYTENRDQELIRTFISTPIYTKLYLHSAYIYYANSDKVIVSEQGLMQVSNFYDRQWLEAINEKGEEMPEVARRSLKQYAFEKNETEIVSISRKYYTSKNHTNYGLVTLNYLVDKVNERLKRFVNNDRQSIYVIYKTGESLFEARKLPGVSEELLQDFLASGKSEAVVEADGEWYVAYKLENEHLEFTYLFLSPLSDELKPALPMLGMIFCVMVFTAVFGIILSWVMTRRRHTLQNQVSSIIEYYEESGKYPEDIQQIEEYDYFFQSVLKIFEEHRRAIVLDCEKQIQLERAEIKALQMQINPHFLYNTMETIYWKVMEAANGYCPANQMIADLSDILHYSLSEDDDLVELKKELLIAEKYIQIQKMRFGDFFEVIWDHAESCMATKVPKLFLQPLIENAVQHGLLAGCTEECVGKIKIRVRDLGEEVMICVIDDGAGVAGKNLTEIKRLLKEGKAGDGHIGLFNTNLRIRLHFGEQYGIEIFSKSGIGTAVRVRIPKNNQMN